MAWEKYHFKVSEKQKSRKNRCPRKEHPVWILLLRANMFQVSEKQSFRVSVIRRKKAAARWERRSPGRLFCPKGILFPP